MKIDHIKLLADYFPAIKQRHPVRKTSLTQKIMSVRSFARPFKMGETEVGTA